MNCWKCKERCETAVCVSCGEIQPPPANPNPFAILNLNQSYFLELSEIESAYRKLSRQVHPDRYVNAPAVSRRMALQWMAAINSARRVLLDVRKRARWLATGTSTVSEESTPSDPTFLELVFELQMLQSEDPKAANDSVNRHIQKIEDEVIQIFRNKDLGTGDLSEVESKLNRLQYLSKIQVME